ncbi:MAG: hypothetical protein R3E97_00780 [Candidatus Eisenbacteria bacterium]
MGRFVIAAYKPKPGMEDDLRAVVASHLDVLRAESLVTDRPAYVMTAANGTIVEVFEWSSAEAIAKAHGNPAVQKLWEEFGRVSEYVPLASLEEANQMFAEFEALQ